jgi:hypothetical protein
MPFDGSGNFNRLFNWVTDALGGLFINATKMDQEFNGIATALSDCVTRDGQSPPTTNLPMGTKKLTGLGPGSAATDSASIVDVTSRIAVAEWQAFSGATLQFVNATQFKTLALDTTGTFVRGRRLKIVVTAGTTYCNVNASTFGGGDTTVTVTNLNPFNLDAGLSAVNYGLISNTPTSAPQFGYALFRTSGDQAITLNTDTQLTWSRCASPRSRSGRLGCSTSMTASQPTRSASRRSTTAMRPSSADSSAPMPPWQCN